MPSARAQLVAIGTAVPERRLTNDDLAARVATSDAWIVARTGIRERRICEPGTGLSRLAVPAAQRCLQRAGVAAQDLDGIIVATITPDMVMPATANLVQHQLGACRAWGFDLANACNGFVAALACATAWIESGRARRVLIIGGDIMSSIVDWDDRATCVLFGDGCGAVLVEAGPPDGPGVRSCQLWSDGSGGADLCVPLSGSAMPKTAEALARRDHCLKQQGRTVFAHAVRRMSEAAQSILRQEGLSAADLDLVVPHQANLRIIEPMAERLGVPMSKVVVNLERYGNTTAATIPLALADAEAEGRLRAGSRVLLVAFGGGYAWGAAYVVWGRG
ncbi:MAG: beta-ketoacyl-ACP synthase III [Planctomycetota bacterium]|nr:ketoacyl-ACP synthase III [Planctomycetota bacterium]MDW8372920.1 beta-ketoacyl-ACP synthase III [Planctomycetota bacterium]